MDGVIGVSGIGGEIGTGTPGSELVVSAWARESTSSRTRTKLFIVRRTLLMSRLLVGRVDASFKVDPRRWRELEAMNNQ